MDNIINGVVRERVIGEKEKSIGEVQTYKKKYTNEFLVWYNDYDNEFSTILVVLWIVEWFYPRENYNMLFFFLVGLVVEKKIPIDFFRFSSLFSSFHSMATTPTKPCYIFVFVFLVFFSELNNYIFLLLGLD